MTVFPSSFLAEIEADLTTLCRVWAITRIDGVVFRYTDHDADLVVGGNRYSSTNAFTASAIQLVANGLASDCDIQFVFSDTGIERNDLERGLFNNAAVQFGVASYSAPAAGIVPLFDGVALDAATAGNTATLTLRSNSHKITAPVCPVYSRTCRAQFGDGDCKVDLGPYTFVFTVTGVTNSIVFTATELAEHNDNVFANGLVTFTTGKNKGVKVECIRSTDTGVLTLLLRPPYPVETGDTGNVVYGCVKTVDACASFGNTPNYRGEPFIPGEEGLSL